MKLRNRMLVLAIPAVLAGCAEMPKNMPLVFGETITFGGSIGVSTTDQSIDVTVGFKSKDVAVVPVTTGEDGKASLLAKVINVGAADKAVSESSGKTEYTNPKNIGESDDSLSVIGQFSSETDGAGRRIGLGKFFATGAAAQVLSQGFQDCLSAGHCGGSGGGNTTGTGGSSLSAPTPGAGQSHANP